MTTSPEAVRRGAGHPEEGTGEEHKDTGDTRKLEHQIAQDAGHGEEGKQLRGLSHRAIQWWQARDVEDVYESIAMLQGVPGEPLDGSQEGVRVWCTVPQAA
jgi:hypothetical protein